MHQIQYLINRFWRKEFDVARFRQCLMSMMIVNVVNEFVAFALLDFEFDAVASYFVDVWAFRRFVFGKFWLRAPIFLDNVELEMIQYDIF
jgi:hypothetical protein